MPNVTPAPARSGGPAAPARWARLRRRFKLPRGLKVTREGKFFVGITFGVGLAAVNTANNLLFVLLGMLLALIAVSSVMSEISLRHLTVVRRLPRRAQVGRPHFVEIEVYNTKKKIPSYAIEVEDLRAAQPADKRCFFLKVSPESTQVAAYRRIPTRRGCDVHSGFRIATRFPFGLFEKSREVSSEGELIIYPAVDTVRLPPGGVGTAPGLDTSRRRGQGDEFLGLRPMREGEDPRDIYWRKSAATGYPVLRDRASESRPDVHLTLDIHKPPGANADWDVAFERRIRDVASRAVAHIKRGDHVTVVTSAGATTTAGRAVGADPLLRFLAKVQPVPQDAPRVPAPTRAP